MNFKFLRVFRHRNKNKIKNIRKWKKRRTEYICSFRTASLLPQVSFYFVAKKIGPVFLCRLVHVSGSSLSFKTRKVATPKLQKPSLPSHSFSLHMSLSALCVCELCPLWNSRHTDQTSGRKRDHKWQQNMTETLRIVSFFCSFSLGAAPKSFDGGENPAVYSGITWWHPHVDKEICKHNGQYRAQQKSIALMSIYVTMSRSHSSNDRHGLLVCCVYEQFSVE